MKKRMMVICVILVIFTFSCAEEVYTITSDAEHRITVQAFDDNLKTDYGVKSLKKHEIYLDDDLLEAQFYLTKEFTGSDIESLKMFVINTFIYQKIDNYAPSGYNPFLIEHRETRPLAKKFALVFFGEDKINQVVIYDERLKVIEEITP